MNLFSYFAKKRAEKEQLIAANAELIKMLKQKQLVIGAMDSKLIQSGVIFDFVKDVENHEQALAKNGGEK